jgi:hypothetical protein
MYPLGGCDWDGILKEVLEGGLGRCGDGIRQVGKALADDAPRARHLEARAHHATGHRT